VTDAHASPVTSWQYAAVRLLLGGYLTIHFVELIPYGTELFSAEGLLPADLSPLLGIIPNPLSHFDSPTMVSGLLVTGAVCGLLLAAGILDRVAGIVAAVILGWLFARNPLISNPSMPVVGWMLIAHAFTPRLPHTLGVFRGVGDRAHGWSYPWLLWFSAWWMLAVAYTYSGFTKLLSPSWVDGSAIRLVLENPLARDHALRSLMLDLPPIVLETLTWFVIAIELLFVLFCLHAMTRKWAWAGMFLVQLGFLAFLNFADLTFPMLLIHVLTFDPRWLPGSSQAASRSDHYVMQKTFSLLPSRSRK